MAEDAPPAVQEQGSDTNTRDASGRRYGGEQLEGAQEATPFIWLTVFVIFAGFSVGGAAIILDSLALFIVGTAIAAVGGIAALAAGIMNVTE